MRIMTASEASRSFSAVLDDAEHGETIVITRGKRRVAQIVPTNSGTVGALREALRDWTPVDDDTLGDDVAAALEGLGPDRDPWND
jgi:antitoxin (DNA-binding transcriptional repressor) of toxin-antitoxin stability system